MLRRGNNDKDAGDSSSSSSSSSSSDRDLRCFSEDDPLFKVAMASLAALTTTVPAVGGDGSGGTTTIQVVQCSKSRPYTQPL